MAWYIRASFRKVPSNWYVSVPVFQASNQSFNTDSADSGTGEEETPQVIKERMSPAEWNTIYKMSQDKALYTNLINSLFPTIHGNEEVKRGILLMLFGGVAKRTGDGTALRGDINVCIVGDPSTAKSQLLKQVADFWYVTTVGD